MDCADNCLTRRCRSRATETQLPLPLVRPEYRTDLPKTTSILPRRGKGMPFLQHSYVPLMNAGSTGSSYFSASRPTPALKGPRLPLGERVPSGNRMTLPPSRIVSRQRETACRSNRCLSMGIALPRKKAIFRFSGWAQK